MRAFPGYFAHFPLNYQSLLPALALAALLSACAGSPSVPGGGSAQPPAPSATGWKGDLVVQTDSGPVRGRVDRGGALAWKGLPYAASPVGELRWKAPRAVTPWTGIRNAYDFGPFAPQRAPFLGATIGSEDCLYLNVWRPAGPSRGLPIYVYIYGGGNSTGAANLVDDYLGWGVAAKSGMVFVSMNYRVGPFGWFLDPSVSGAADPDSASGNFGTLDLIAALAWIRRNAEAFGGDPERVTIAGESAGAFNVLSLLASPAAGGLFHRAVVESGYLGFVSRDEARQATDGLFASLLLKRGRAKNQDEAARLVAATPPAERAALLRSASAGELLGLQKPGPTGMTGWPSVIADGRVVPADVLEAFAEGRVANPVPLIIGSNREETKLFLYFEGKLDWRDPLYGATARYGALSWKATGVDAIADSLASSPSRPPVYVYRFDWGAPDGSGRSPLPGAWGERVGAFHSAEVSFFLGTESCLGPLFTGRLFTTANRPGREELSRGIMAYLASFAATGDPNAAKGGLPSWPRRPEGLGVAATRGLGASTLPTELVLDASAERASFVPLNEVVTKESAARAIDEELPGELAARVKSRLAGR